ncbi:hypothetical protein [Thalassobacillus cyri]|uniref:hypothetical protein n=1 Tax=Thalassobacillus cyri TaxID=571932 RepID=UPI00115FE1A1|nr:hypothetical protein [Thalassobacillus cyri]
MAKVPLLVMLLLMVWSFLGGLIWSYMGRAFFEHFLMLSLLVIPYLLLHFILKEYDLFYSKQIGKLEKWTGTYSYSEILNTLELNYQGNMPVLKKMIEIRSAIWKYCDYNRDNLLNLIIILNSLKDAKEKDKNTTILVTIMTGAMFLALRSGILVNHIFTFKALSESQVVYYNILSIVLLGLVFILALIRIYSGEYKSITLLANLTEKMYEEKKEE